MGLICGRDSFPPRMPRRRKTADLLGFLLSTLHFMKDGVLLFVPHPSESSSFAPLRMTISCPYSLFAGFNHLFGVLDGRIGELGAA